MPVFSPKPTIPGGIPKEAERAITQAFGQIYQDLSSLFDDSETLTPVQGADYSASLGDLVRIVPPASGMRVLLPVSTAAVGASRVRLAVLSTATGGAITVSVVGGQLINALPTYLINRPGVYEFSGCGDSGWSAPVSPADLAWPIGSVFITLSAANPAVLLGVGTWTQIAGGRMLLGVDGSHPVGTTGGTSTPAGTVSAPVFTGNSGATSSVSAGTASGSNNNPIFTGNALATHAHELPYAMVDGTGTNSFFRISSATFGTGTSRSAVQHLATAWANDSSSHAVDKSQAISAGTPSGTVSAPLFTGDPLPAHSHNVTPSGTNSVPTFTGTPNLPPYLAVNIWQRTA